MKPGGRKSMPDGRAKEQRDAALVTVSNRLPVTLRRGPSGPERVRSSGGLVAAFAPILEDRGGVWIGWPGLELRPGESVSASDDPYHLEPVGIPRQDFKPYYQGFSNRTLWPLFHTLPGQAVFETSEWEAYERVNERFAEATAAAIGAEDHVVVNDYQLMLVPGRLRKLAPSAAIAFFLHIPFPPYDVFRVLPWARPLLRGMLAADLVGLHVSGYVRNFLDCANRLLGLKVDQRRGIVHMDGRTVRVMALPLGIDFKHYEQLAQEAPGSGFHGDEQVVLGVDRLDYTKGIPQRIHAFARLLEAHSDHRGKVTLLQLAVPSRSEVREYKELKREIDELVGQVNGRFGSANWTPIRYLYRSVSPEKLAAMYRDANVGFVTPLRDGMNLVAKEYVACQVDNPGVLVLSHTAGAAETMTEALLVNPYDIDDTAAKLHQALTMTKKERRARMQALRKRESKHDVHQWAKRLVQRLGRAAKENG
jgi:trehalose 6-phosphate synthase/phosphatase